MYRRINKTDVFNWFGENETPLMSRKNPAKFAPASKEILDASFPQSLPKSILRTRVVVNNLNKHINTATRL